MSAEDPPEPAAGIALLCDAAGLIREVVRDGLGIAARVGPGRAFGELVHEDCRQKAGAFLETLGAQQAAFNWELTVPLEDGRLVALHFAGGATDDGFLIVGARSRAGVARVYEGLVRINNEQSNALRAAMKDLSLAAREGAARDGDHFDELTRLNNELATAQRELARKNAELSRLNEQKNQFLGIAAHDLRNPLEVILTYSQFLRDEASLSAEHLEFVETITSSSRFMLNLVEELLDLAKIEAGRLELDLAPTDLVALARRNVARNRVLAQKQGVEISFAGPAEGLQLALDRGKIEQVLNNLLGNGIKFSPPGGLVAVRVERVQGAARLEVADHGPGIPAEELEKLFRPFTRTRVRSARGEKGAGLGLAIVKRIVEGHGGAISVRSEVGAGTTFEVSLPVAPDESVS